MKGESAPGDYGEIICHECMGKHTFLWKYSDLCIKAKESLDESLNISVTDNVKNGCDETQENKNENASDKNSPKKCYIKTNTNVVGTGTTYWPNGWRKHLCRCNECLSMYENEKVSFLLNENDTVLFYENKNKELAKETQYEKGLKALSSLDRVKQVEAIEGKF